MLDGIIKYSLTRSKERLNTLKVGVKQINSRANRCNLMPSLSKLTRLLICFFIDIQTKLEKLNLNLQQCWKSLLNHLERRRQKFPRFYFLSTEDVLHIVCNGMALLRICSPFYFLNHAKSTSEKNKMCKFLKNLLSIERSCLEDKASN